MEDWILDDIDWEEFDTLGEFTEWAIEVYKEQNETDEVPEEVLEYIEEEWDCYVDSLM